MKGEKKAEERPEKQSASGSAVLIFFNYTVKEKLFLGVTAFN